MVASLPYASNVAESPRVGTDYTTAIVRNHPSNPCIHWGFGVLESDDLVVEVGLSTGSGVEGVGRLTLASFACRSETLPLTWMLTWAPMFPLDCSVSLAILSEPMPAVITCCIGFSLLMSKFSRQPATMRDH